LLILERLSVRLSNILSFRWFFASVVVIVVTRRRHSLFSQSLSLSLVLSFSFSIYLLYFLSLLIAQFLQNISNLIISSWAFLSETHARCIFHVHTHVLSRCLFSLFHPGLVCIRRWKMPLLYRYCAIRSVNLFAVLNIQRTFLEF